MTNGVEQLFTDPTMVSLKLSLQAAAARHMALASNIANVNTPGYHRVDLSPSFKSSLDGALHEIDQSRSADINVEPQASMRDVTVQDVQGQARFDGNTVNMDQEMTEMIKNQTDFDFSSRLLAMKYTAIKDAITGKTS